MPTRALKEENPIHTCKQVAVVFGVGISHHPLLDNTICGVRQAARMGSPHANQSLEHHGNQRLGAQSLYHICEQQRSSYRRCNFSNECAG
jgi:hypothetical protein